MVLKHTRGVKLLLKVAKPATPTVFEAFCSINAARGISFTSSTSDFNLPNCDDPEEIAWVVREKDGLSVAVNGAGILNTPDIKTYFEWLKDPNSWPAMMVVDVPVVDGGVIFAGNFHLTDFDITGDRGGKAENSIALASDGEIEISDNA